MNLSKSTHLRIVHVLRLSILLSFIVLATVRANAGSIDSTPITGKINIDGEKTDWSTVPVQFLEESVHQFAVTHDEEKLYLMFYFANWRTAQMIQKRGITLWINGDGKKLSEFGIRYRGSAEIADVIAKTRAELGFAEEEERPMPQEGDSAGEERGAKPPRQRQAHGTLRVSTEDDEYTLEETNTYGPTAASALHDGVYCYEFSVPFIDIGGIAVKAKPESKRKLFVGVELGGLSTEERERMQEMMGGRGGTSGGGGGMKGGMAGGRGGGRSGGMGGGRGGGRSGDMSSRGGSDRTKRILMGEIEWMKVVLQPVGD